VELLPANLTLSDVNHWIFALILGYGRMLGLLILFPLFSWIGRLNTIRNGAAVAFALPMVPFLMETVPLPELTFSIPYIIMLGKEVFIGVMLGLFTAVPIWGVQGAGDLIDTYRGASSANLFDPNMALEAPITGMLFIIAMLCIFLISGGLQIVLGAVYDSYTIWPAATPWPELSMKSAAAMGGLVDKFLMIGIVIAAPLLIAMFLAEATLAFTSQINKRGNLWELDSAIKNVVYSFLLPIYMLFVVKYFGRELTIMRELVGYVKIWVPAN